MSDKENTKEQAQPLTEESKEEQPKAEENMVGKVAEAQKNQGSFKLLLLILMVLQNSSTVLVSRYLRASVPKDDLFIVNHLVCVTEVAKVSPSCCTRFYASLLTSRYVEIVFPFLHFGILCYQWWICKVGARKYLGTSLGCLEN
mmetsp:Transcript_2741/g.6118  ORF Transcript_2741/g.6118 Transcript_2741/m.6118 type:complete len:144 (+) Transcript_2741:147-578(+)